MSEKSRQGNIKGQYSRVRTFICWHELFIQFAHRAVGTIASIMITLSCYELFFAELKYIFPQHMPEP